MLDILNYREKQDLIKKFGYSWFNIFAYLIIHITAFYSLLHIKNYHLKLFIFQFIIHTLSILGVTKGIHRYYNHRSFEFKKNILGTIAKIMITYFSVQSGNGSIKLWCRAHRTHHRNSDIYGSYDPYDIHYGFWYAHCLWLFNLAYEKHPEILKTNINDLNNDNILSLFDKNQIRISSIYILSAYIVPTIFGWKILKLKKINVFMTCFIRQVITSHITFSINSLAHMIGNHHKNKRTINKNITPINSVLLSILTSGEGYHNYHHTKCHDYRCNNKSHCFKNPNLSAFVIDLMDKFSLLSNKKQY